MQVCMQMQAKEGQRVEESGRSEGSTTKHAHHPCSCGSVFGSAVLGFDVEEFLPGFS